MRKKSKNSTRILVSTDMPHKKIAAFYFSKRLKKLPSPSETGEEAERKSLSYVCNVCVKGIFNGHDDLPKTSAAFGPKSLQQGILVIHEPIQ